MRRIESGSTTQPPERSDMAKDKGRGYRGHQAKNPIPGNHRRKLDGDTSDKAFDAGTKVDRRNLAPGNPMRGGIRM